MKNIRNFALIYVCYTSGQSIIITNHMPIFVNHMMIPMKVDIDFTTIRGQKVGQHYDLYHLAKMNNLDM